jgi:hypothetical protein
MHCRKRKKKDERKPKKKQEQGEKLPNQGQT